MTTVAAAATASAVHARAIVIDGVNLTVPTRDRLERIHAAGVTALNVPLPSHEKQTEAARAIAAWAPLLADPSDPVRPVLTSADVHAAKREGRVGIVYGFQN